MFKSLVLLIAAAAAVGATGEFVVLHSPDSVRFHGNEVVALSLLKEIYPAAMGFTVKMRESWSGMSIMDPFNLPGALVTVVVEGIDSLDIPDKERFPLIVDEDEETAWQAVRRRCEMSGSNNTFVRFSFEDGVIALGQSALGTLTPMPVDTLPVQNMDLNREEDIKCLEQVQLMRAIAKNAPTVAKSDSRPNIYWLVFSGIGPICQTHGKNSSVTKEALSLLSGALNAISEAFIEAYEGKVLITAFTNDATQVRHTRSVILERNARDASNLEELKKVPDTVAPEYDENYPVIFNIVLWFGVVFCFSLLAICIAIADMDPGRDSIIFRMTSNRMKKEN